MKVSISNVPGRILCIRSYRSVIDRARVAQKVLKTQKEILDSLKSSARRDKVKLS